MKYNNDPMMEDIKAPEQPAAEPAADTAPESTEVQPETVQAQETESAKEEAPAGEGTDTAEADKEPAGDTLAGPEPKPELTPEAKPQ